jgi:hypothetical protein
VEDFTPLTPLFSSGSLYISSDDLSAEAGARENTVDARCQRAARTARRQHRSIAALCCTPAGATLRDDDEGR